MWGGCGVHKSDISLQLYISNQPNTANNSGIQSIPNHVFDDLDISVLNNDTQAEVIRAKGELDTASSISILNFGSKASEKFTEFSSSILENFSARDIPDIMEYIPTMEGAFNQISKRAIMPKQGIFRIFSSDKPMTTSEFIDKYNNAADVVSKVKTRLTQIDFELAKDIEIDRQFGLQVIDMIKELECYILAAKLAMQELKEAEKKHSSELDSERTSLHGYFGNELRDNIDRLNRKIYNLSLQRVEALQTLPILAQMIKGSEGLSEQIKTAISQGIPTWEKSILISIHLYRQQSAIKSEEALRSMTNNLIRQNASMMKENCESIAKAVQDGLIDVDALQEANDKIMSSARSLSEIMESGSRTRQEQLGKLSEIQKQLMGSSSKLGLQGDKR